jgi:hypothetical protein
MLPITAMILASPSLAPSYTFLGSRFGIKLLMLEKHFQIIKQTPINP